MNEQINIRVVKFPKKRPKWGVNIRHLDGDTNFPLNALLPGEFRYRDARAVANVLATMYRANGYRVTLDTKTCNKRPTAATSAYGVA